MTVTGWTDEAPEAAPPVTAPGMWLPASVLRRQAAEDAAERREARRAERAREERQAAAHDRAVGAYRAAAGLRGEHVSAMSLATGEDIGRTVADVFADAIAQADHADARERARARREAGIEPEHVIVGRSGGWPPSAYELDRLLSRARDLHSALVMYQAGRDYPAALEATRARSSAGRHAQLGGQSGNIVR